MKAVMYYGQNDLRVEDIPEPPAPAAGEVTIKVAWAGICGSDLHLYHDGPSYPTTPTADRPQPRTGETLPVVLGHEFAGTVAEVGDGVTGLGVGDAVAVKADVPCGACPACTAGLTNICRNSRGFGLSGGGGGLSEFVTVPAANAFAVGDLPLDQAAMIEPLSVATHGVRRSGATAGDLVLVGGAGPIGVLASAVLTATGATVIISEPNAARRASALDAGVAAHVVDPMNEDLQAIVAEVTSGNGVDVAFDCAGVIPVTHDLIKAIRPGGHLQVIAIPSRPLDLDVQTEMHLTEITYSGMFGYLDEDYREAIAMARSADLDLGQFISKRISPEHIVDEGFAVLLDKGNTAVKILVDPTA
ncbi:(R,R)-butanediol dehydrogenase/meso-butanediol dehydrogenase/diacetyl reductase [Brevibacterium sanguinis]|uniref:(R,R)-butanediol dehydrogenase/meso-butanediol dehydrogenase/diacetyl reductase n=2 Tax=Brevibacterium TaxID=1696 RepID=A0A366ILV7_9MICO|nr:MULTISPECIES: alcohol dehydrogenase catalytic domain-containing protein [Brevibacterium]RBP67186.1 (R,R)-butanediol dehydrogenase/meso-butanediol dehydrogenase/diacetyl reductase [Brevibacterium sanguinis]RBP73711.1 (R,R)-butanediol dehydrogenase/meso-butanediol dehydrogenase/diacetyl reductase [Brevibacterium celere]